MSANEPTPQAHHPFFHAEARELKVGDFSREEVRLANRNSGTLLETLRHDLTPTGLHYLLTHFDVPYVTSAEGWTLEIGGLIERPMRLTLEELQRCPEHSLRVTLECAGNGRAALTPRRPHHADPIRQAQAGRVEHARKLTILLCAHDELCVDSGHKLGYAILDEALDALQSGAHVEAVDPDSENSGFCQASCR